MGASFDPSASYVPAGLRKAAKEATNLGWTAKKSGREGWFLRSPKGSEKFYIPSTCKDADTLARKLRSKINNAYVNERSAFKPDLPPEAASVMLALAESAMAKGAVIVPGPDPHITCPVCDDEYEGWEAFANHQDDCAKAADAAKRQREATVQNQPIDRFIEGASQGVTEQAESAHSGTISTKEETPLATQSSTPTPKPGPQPGSAAQRNPETGRKQGYRWKVVNGRGNPLHEILYTAVRMNRRLREETDSNWTYRLAEFIESEGLLGKLPEADPDLQAAYVLGQIRDLLGGGEPQGPSEEEIEQFKKDIAERDEQIAGLTKKVDEYKDFFSTMSELAPKEPK